MPSNVGDGLELGDEFSLRIAGGADDEIRYRPTKTGGGNLFSSSSMPEPQNRLQARR